MAALIDNPVINSPFAEPGGIFTGMIVASPAKSRRADHEPPGVPQPGTSPEGRGAVGPEGGSKGPVGARAMKGANLGRERWVYGLHALAGLLLAFWR